MSKKEYYDQHEIDFPTYNRESLDRLLIDAIPIVHRATGQPIHTESGEGEHKQMIDATAIEKVLEVMIRPADEEVRSYRLNYSGDGGLSVLRGGAWSETDLASSATPPFIADVHRAVFLLITETAYK